MLMYVNLRNLNLGKIMKINNVKSILRLISVSLLLATSLSAGREEAEVQRLLTIVESQSQLREFRDQIANACFTQGSHARVAGQGSQRKGLGEMAIGLIRQAAILGNRDALGALGLASIEAHGSDLGLLATDLGGIFQGMGMFAEAGDAYRIGINLENLEAIIYLSSLASQQGNEEQIKRELIGKNLPCGHELTVKLFDLGVLLYQAKDRDITPSEIATIVHVGNLLHAKGNFQAALKAYLIASKCGSMEAEAIIDRITQ